MTTSKQGLDMQRPLATDNDLQEMLLGLLKEANQRQLWLILLDGEQRLTGPLMPIEDLPRYPDHAAPILCERFAEIAALVGAASIVLVWERPGPDRAFADDLAWARATNEGAGRHKLAIRAQFILHDHGIRRLTPDDLV
ncbi:MAG: hypothetical protein WAW85_11970 [Gordonia sp. (in: high G+C Gram-positive bacteria)]|uniref:hypothetical protein n=1 Tax=Gordonia sp. (in: high G+C Gram-positive bacteria) TaxID=84139 RepID=UPI003BB748B8